MPAVLAACAVAGLAGGCGDGEDQEGRDVFVSAGCGACHALADAKTTGETCPNLDRITPSVEHVRRFVSNGGIGMPAYSGSLSEDQIELVAEYVASVAGP